MLDNIYIVPSLFYFVIFLVHKYFYNKSYNTNRKRIRSLSSFKYLHSLIRISSLIILLLSFYYPQSWLYILFHSTYTLYIGMMISVIATVLFLSAKVTLGRNYSPCYDSYLPQDIIRTGLYKYVRHPIYLSNILLLIGVFISTGSQLLLINFAILLVYYTISAINEEKALLKSHPKYQSYQTQTSMFIPTKFKMRK